ncbi:unnamed protein product [Effrenium voratum]|nr:unnamed protein product [Effrenium voratum]
MIVDFKPTTFLSVHSGTLGLYMPWAYDSEHLAQRNRQAMLSVLQELDAAHCKCPFGAAGKEVGYDCPGTSFDWVYDNLKTPFSFAWEIYANPIEGDSLRARSGRRRWPWSLCCRAPPARSPWRGSTRGSTRISWEPSWTLRRPTRASGISTPARRQTTTRQL